MFPVPPNMIVALGRDCCVRDLRLKWHMLPIHPGLTQKIFAMIVKSSASKNGDLQCESFQVNYNMMLMPDEQSAPRVANGCWKGNARTAERNIRAYKSLIIHLNYTLSPKQK
jgi:hypothetical protein